jgi:lysophospholipase L1-like esterase
MLVRCVMLLVVSLMVVSAGEPLRVVCFGDSITGHRPNQPYLRHYVKWSDLLGLMIEGKKGVGQVAMVNAGYAGDGTSRSGDKPGALARLEGNVLAIQPDIAVVLLGGNDASRMSAAETQANLVKIFSQIHHAGIRCLALQYHALATKERSPKAWIHLDDNNPAIAAAAAEVGIPVLDLAPAMNQALAEHAVTDLVDKNDLVHLRPAGELVIARAVFAKLEELGWLTD